MSSNISGQGAVGDQQEPEGLTPEQELEENLAGVLEMIQNLSDDPKGTKKSEKKDKAASEGVFANVDVFGLLGDIVGKPGDAAKTVSEFLRNPGSPGGPKLFPPIRDLRDVPTGNAGAGNAWLSGSVFTELTMILFEIMPILFQIKLQEAALESEQIQLLQEVTIKGAEMAKKKKELEAKEIRLEAYKQFVQAGISIAMAGMQLGAASGASVKGAVKSAGSKLKTAGGMGFRGAKMAGNWGSGKMKDGWSNMKSNTNSYGGSFARGASGKWGDIKASGVGQKFGTAGGKIGSMRDSYRDTKSDFADRKTLLAGKLKGEDEYGDDSMTTKQRADLRRTKQEENKINTASERADKKRASADSKKQNEAQRLMARNQMFQAMNSGLTGIAGGLYDLEKAKVREQIGVVEYLQGVFQGLQSVHQKTIDSAHEARREAGEALSTYMQQFQSIIEAQRAFRYTR